MGQMEESLGNVAKEATDEVLRLREENKQLQAENSHLKHRLQYMLYSCSKCKGTGRLNTPSGTAYYTCDQCAGTGRHY